MTDPESYEALEEDYQVTMRELERVRANADQLRAECGECHLMISLGTSEFQLQKEWESTSLPPRFQRVFRRAEHAEAALAQAERELREIRKSLYLCDVDRTRFARELTEARAEVERLREEAEEGVKALTAERNAAQTRVRELEDDVRRLGQAILWADGQHGDFRPREPGEGAFWWRKELMQRSGLRPA